MNNLRKTLLTLIVAGSILIMAAVGVNAAEENVDSVKSYNTQEDIAAAVQELPSSIKFPSDTIKNWAVGSSVNLKVNTMPEVIFENSLLWSSSNTDVATIDNNGLLTAVSSGKTTITCASVGNNPQVKDSITITVYQPVTSVKLNRTTLNWATGTTASFTATVSPSNATNKNVIFSSSNTNVATVTAAGKLTAVAPGNATITCKAADGSGKTATCKVTVYQGVTSVKLNKTTLNWPVGKVGTFTATVSPSNAVNKDVIFTSSNAKVATITSAGKITAVAPGNATITCKAKDGSGKKTTCEVTVYQPVTSVKLNRTTLNWATGTTASFTATVSPSNATNKNVIFSSSNTNVATVTAAGKLTAVAPGNATITCKAEDGSGKTATCKVTVYQAVTSVKLNKTTLNWPVGKVGTFTATVSPSNATNKNVIFTSSNEKVATITTAGKIKAVAPGSATITCKAADGSGKTATCKVTVYQGVTSVKLNRTTLNWATGTTASFTATVSPSNATNKNVTFSSSNTKVATVTAAGKLTAVAPGNAIITCKAEDGSGKTATCKVTVYQGVTSVKLNKTTLNWPTGKVGTFTATVAPSNAKNKKVTFSSSNTKVATITPEGKITAVSPGNATITCKAADGSGKTATCKVTVYQGVTSIKLNRTTLNWAIGTTASFKATVSPSNAVNKNVTFSSSNTKVATVTANGKLTAIAPGTAIITCTAVDGSAKKATCKVTVYQGVTGIKLNTTKLNWFVGKTGTFTATVSPSNAKNKTVSYSSSNTKVATVDQNGKLTAVGEGSAIITCKAKDGTGIKTTCTVNVKGYKYGTETKAQYNAVVAKCKELINSEAYAYYYALAKEYPQEVKEIFGVKKASDKLNKHFAANQTLGQYIHNYGTFVESSQSSNAYDCLINGINSSYGSHQAAVIAMCDQLGIMQAAKLWYTTINDEYGDIYYFAWPEIKINGEWIRLVVGPYDHVVGSKLIWSLP